MTTALSSIPQTKIEAETSRHREQKAVEDRFSALQRSLEQIRIAPRPAPIAPVAPAGPNTIAPGSTPASRPPIPVPLRIPAVPSRRPPPTDAQKAQLTAILRECVRRTNPDTPDGHAQHQRDIASWSTRYGANPRAELQLERMGYPLSPGIPPPCSGECWRCGIGSYPPHVKTDDGCG